MEGNSRKLNDGDNVLIGIIDTRTIDLFFGPIEPGDTFEQLHLDAEWDDIAIMLGLFKSRTQARKNGWKGPIPEGFTHKKFSKGKKQIWILKNGDWNESTP